jgi:DNA-binding MarR family transcriptional regulator
MHNLPLFDVLERLNSLMRIWFRQHPLLAELQPVQLSALIYLARCNHYSNTPQGVTEYLGLTKGTVSQSVKLLEAKGFICKTADKRDKRVVHLQLTDEALALLDTVLPPDFLIKGKAGLGQRGDDLENLLFDLLREIQRSNNVPAFGLCKSCRYHRVTEFGPFCGLTNESLKFGDERLICREHQPADESSF